MLRSPERNSSLAARLAPQRCRGPVREEFQQVCEGGKPSPQGRTCQLAVDHRGSIRLSAPPLADGKCERKHRIQPRTKLLSVCDLDQDMCGKRLRCSRASIAMPSGPVLSLATNCELPEHHKYQLVRWQWDSRRQQSSSCGCGGEQRGNAGLRVTP